MGYTQNNDDDNYNNNTYTHPCVHVYTQQGKGKLSGGDF